MAVRDGAFALINLAWAGMFLHAFWTYGDLEIAEYNHVSMIMMSEGLALVITPIAILLLRAAWRELVRDRTCWRVLVGHVLILMGVLGIGGLFAWQIARWQGAEWVFPVFWAMLGYKSVAVLTAQAAFGDRRPFWRDPVGIACFCAFPAYVIAQLIVLAEMPFVGGEPAMYLMLIQFGFFYFVLMTLYRLAEDPRWRWIFPIAGLTELLDETAA